METFNIDLNRIAREDKKTVEDTTRAFREAIRLARREEEDAPVDAVVMRIVNLRKTFQCTLARAVLLWDAQVETGFQNPKPRHCKMCGKRTAQSSYYYCPAHLRQAHTVEHGHDEYLRHGNS